MDLMERRRGRSIGYALFALMGGCSALSGLAVQRYDLGLPTAMASAPIAVTIRVRAPEWLDHSGIRYRLAYADDGQVAKYSKARWDASAIRLLERRLLAQLGAAGASGQPGCRLDLEVREFAHIFLSPTRSSGLVDVEGTLTAPKTQDLQRKVWQVQRPAATPDAAGGVSALRASTDELGRQIGQWLRTDDVAKACGSTGSATLGVRVVPLQAPLG